MNCRRMERKKGALEGKRGIGEFTSFKLLLGMPNASPPDNRDLGHRAANLPNRRASGLSLGEVHYPILLRLRLLLSLTASNTNSVTVTEQQQQYSS